MKKEKTAFQHQKHIPSVKHGGGNIMVWNDKVKTKPELKQIEILCNDLKQAVLIGSTRSCQGPSVSKGSCFVFCLCLCCLLAFEITDPTFVSGVLIAPSSCFPSFALVITCSFLMCHQCPLSFLIPVYIVYVFPSFRAGSSHLLPDYQLSCSSAAE